MTSQIASFLSQGLTACLGWLDEVMTQIDAWDLLLGMFVLTMAVRFLLKPILGQFSVGSDTVERKYWQDKLKGKGE